MHSLILPYCSAFIKRSKTIISFLFIYLLLTANRAQALNNKLLLLGGVTNVKCGVSYVSLLSVVALTLRTFFFIEIRFHLVSLTI